MTAPVAFQGKQYRRVEVTVKRICVLDALRSGRLDHLGSLPGNFPGMNQPQVYSAGSTLVCGAVGHNSQHINIAFYLLPFGECICGGC